MAKLIFTDPNTNLTIANSRKPGKNDYIITTPKGMRITLTSREMAGVCLFAYMLIKMSDALNSNIQPDGFVIILDKPPNV